MKLSSYAITKQGQVRHTNEDARQVYAVADGLSGLSGGAKKEPLTLSLIHI